MIVAMTDEDGVPGATGSTGGAPWDPTNALRPTASTGDGIGAGAMNTAMINAILMATEAGDGDNAIFGASIAADFSVQANGTSACTTPTLNTAETCFGDWYLPSNLELQWLNASLAALGSPGGFVTPTGTYWSSTEYYDPAAIGNVVSKAYTVTIGTPGTTAVSKTVNNMVRPIRAF